MFCEPISPSRWRLVLPEPEALLFVSILANLARHYRQNLGELPPAVRAYWKGTVSRELTGPLPAETDPKGEPEPVLSEARLELRSERAALAEKWVREYEIAESRDPWKVELDAQERDDVVAMLNDRRLVVALEIGLTDREHEIDPYKMADESRRGAIMEIDLLGHVIMVILGPQIYHP